MKYIEDAHGRIYKMTNLTTNLDQAGLGSTKVLEDGSEVFSNVFYRDESPIESYKKVPVRISNEPELGYKRKIVNNKRIWSSPEQIIYHVNKNLAVGDAFCTKSKEFVIAFYWMRNNKVYVCYEPENKTKRIVNLTSKKTTSSYRSMGVFDPNSKKKIQDILNFSGDLTPNEIESKVAYLGSTARRMRATHALIEGPEFLTKKLESLLTRFLNIKPVYLSELM